MIRVLVVGGHHEIGVGKSLVRVTDGVSLFHGTYCQRQGKREDDERKNPRGILLKKFVSS